MCNLPSGCDTFIAVQAGRGNDPKYTKYVGKSDWSELAIAHSPPWYPNRGDNSLVNPDLKPSPFTWRTLICERMERYNEGSVSFSILVCCRGLGMSSSLSELSHLRGQNFCFCCLVAVFFWWRVCVASLKWATLIYLIAGSCLNASLISIDYRYHECLPRVLSPSFRAC